METDSPSSTPTFVAGALAWVVGFTAAWLLDGHADLGSQALPLVLAAALASVWWSTWTSTVACVAAALAFNWWFVAPRGSFQVTLSRDVLLLTAMLAVSLGVTLLTARQRRLAAQAWTHNHRTGQLYALSEALRQTENPRTACQALMDVWAAGTHMRPITCWIPAGAAPQNCGFLQGDATPDEHEGLALVAQEGHPLGQGTGRYDNLPMWYLPLRSRAGIQGAALFRLGSESPHPDADRAHAQALCNLLGQTLERLQATQAATAARQASDALQFRSTLLAAVSHDYRTPLASILGAASALNEQADRLDQAQRQRLTHTILEEAGQLVRLTDNALQLARLGGTVDPLLRDWESVEEMVGSVLRRLRSRDPSRRIRARLDPELPLLQCDAVLVVQMLENLVDNALKYSPADTPVDVRARHDANGLLLLVQDRGPGFAAHEADRLFEPFERGEAARTSGARGAGVGLALCRAVIRAHGGSLIPRSRRQGGTCMEVRLPVSPLPLEKAPVP